MTRLPLALPPSVGWRLGSPIRPLALATFNARHDLNLGSHITLQLVGNQHPGRIAQALKELAKEWSQLQMTDDLRG